ncbi:MAG: MgtC/SapB family protein [Syntrophomonadaceae bacterium]|jgi:putative Mg2+ transporter-C (MgtC) family protein|nr:MgtC/SapB family protein [Syntrophomonadaceae bacterium]
MAQFIFNTVLSLLAGFTVSFIIKAVKAARVTFAVITAGASIVCYISMEYLSKYSVYVFSDPSRLGAQVVAVIGFIGTGLILIKEQESPKKVELVAAAGLWLSAIIGIAIGMGLYKLSIFILFLLYFIFHGADFLKRKVSKTNNHKTFLMF